MSTSVAVLPRPARLRTAGAVLIGAAILPLRWLLDCPALVFIAALTSMLFRPPDLKTFPLDRVAFAVMVGAFALRLCLRRDRLKAYSATWPMLMLLLLGLFGVLQETDGAAAWSLLAAKWVVPFALFHISGSVFREEAALRKLEVFSLAVLCYLTWVSVSFLIGATSVIFPRFILDEAIGIHADRARGPLLQAVANGVCLNMLGLVAFDAFRRGILRGIWAVLLFFTVPLALLATRTRAVWLAAALSTIAVVLFGNHKRLRRPALALCALGVIAVCAALLYQADAGNLVERMQDRSPVDFRLEMYEAGWQMFTEKPLLGWGSEANIQPELEKRISNFHPERYLFHNTYLELAVERGFLGLVLYAWLFVSLFRLARKPRGTAALEDNFLDVRFRRLWPIILGVYLLNASAVVMNYQFVNGFLFTLAGILAAQDAASTTHPDCKRS